MFYGLRYASFSHSYSFVENFLFFPIFTFFIFPDFMQIRQFDFVKSQLCMDPEI